MFSETNNKRVYVCFCCGISHHTYQEFKDHVIESHEEGQDYIICPLIHCKSPVRDMRAHFKGSHPGQIMPKVGLLKATIWRDFSGKKTKSKKFKEGWHESPKMGKKFHFRSGYEKTVYELLDKWSQILAYEVESFHIPYIHNGECHNYIPDLFVAFLDGRREIWEIKPQNQTLLEKNKDKWFSAKQACEARGWGFEVITETAIGKLQKTVKDQYLATDEVEDVPENFDENSI